MLSFLESTGLEFQREVTVWFDFYLKRSARVDFVVPFGDRIVYVEVDEHQHVHYEEMGADGAEQRPLAAMKHLDIVGRKNRRGVIGTPGKHCGYP